MGKKLIKKKKVVKMWVNTVAVLNCLADSSCEAKGAGA